jgi:hypothetical protein
VSNLDKLKARIKETEAELRQARNYESTKTAERHGKTARRKLQEAKAYLKPKVAYGIQLGWTDQQLMDWINLTRDELNQLKEGL